MVRLKAFSWIMLMASSVVTASDLEMQTLLGDENGKLQKSDDHIATQSSGVEVCMYIQPK